MAEFILDCIEFYSARDGYGHEERRKPYQRPNDDQLYLGENIYIGSFQWELLQRERPSTFLIYLALHIWDSRDLCNRALDVSKVNNHIPGRSPVKLIENNLLRLLISLYSAFLIRQGYSAEEKVRFLLKVTYILRFKIRDLRREEIEEKSIKILKSSTRTCLT
ncbi:uncharacterized protein LOC116416101 [Nasonia vitripennis]|uniref:Uncharacterized protein n=1 Tax=Nasonia vitripennis TaxID=7425 RepID=A0A7M7Q0I6_NASVI|nr:uncharacterized protein LOC116416101 [Nasonia vitripennis]